MNEDKPMTKEDIKIQLTKLLCDITRLEAQMDYMKKHITRPLDKETAP